VTIRWFLFGQAEELHERLPRLDFRGRSLYVPHLEVNTPRCGDVDEVKAISSNGPVLASGLLTVQVEVCVFQDVVREARGHGEPRTMSRTRLRLEADNTIKVAGQPDSDVGGRSGGDLEVEGTSMGGHRATHLDLDITFFTGNMHIHPVVKGLCAGTVVG